ncbi:MAG: OmpA family protein [Pseudooceanicola sp.]|nr:OmpA family protein [Pseudooceanicola sp.]
MRTAFRQRLREEDEESAFISMTDMTVGFLFIVVILLAFFATQIAPKTEDLVPKQLLEQRDQQVAELQELLLKTQKGGDIVLDLSQKNFKLTVELAEARRAAGLSPEDSLVQKLHELRAEIDRLHRLLKPMTQDNPIEHYNRTVSTELRELLESIRNRIMTADPKIEVTISDSNDALHFTGDGIFAPNDTRPTRAGVARLRTIAGILADEVGCFTFGGPSEVATGCNPSATVIEAVQVEGHTDTDASDLYNMTLSAGRAAKAFGVLVSAQPDLLAYRNLRHQPVVSVAGYGEGRTIADESQPGGKDANRRIDIRFIMYAPVDEASIPLGVDDLQRVRKRLLGDAP